MTTFGKLLRKYREACTNPRTNRRLTQVQLGEIVGYTDSFISLLERDEYQFSGAREVCLVFVTTLYEMGGLDNLSDANEFLYAAGFGPITDDEIDAFPDWREEHERIRPRIEDWEHLKHYLPNDLFKRLRDVSRTERVALCIDHLRNLLQVIVTFVPRYQAIKLLTTPLAPEEQLKGEFLEGTLLFADIAGFTKLAERLIERGEKEGAEEVVELINRSLGIMLGILYQYDGYLIKFGGDAMLCLFRGSKQGARKAIWAAWEMRQQMKEKFEKFELFQEIFSLDVKVGNSSGALFATTVGSPLHLEHFVTGPVVEYVAQAESAAHKGEIIVRKETYDQIFSDLEVEMLEEGGEYYRVTKVLSPLTTPKSDHWANVSQVIANTDFTIWDIAARLDALTPYLPTGILRQLVYNPSQQNATGQHRQVTILFVNFKGLSDLIDQHEPEKAATIQDTIQEYFRDIQEEVAYYHGVINKVDLYNQGDKLMILFGAPHAKELDTRRAALLAQVIQHKIYNEYRNKNSYLRNLEQRIGLHTGFVFSGNVGSDAHHRREYTVMGNAVNLTARLMSAAQFGEILISGEAHKQLHPFFESRPLPPLELKGITEPVGAYRLGSTQLTQPLERADRDFHSPLIGREREKTEFQRYIDNITLYSQKSFLSVIGETGVGKSRLITEIKMEVETVYTDSQKIVWVTGHCRSYAQKPYHVFIALVEQLLGINLNDQQDKKWEKLQEKLRPLLKKKSSDWLEKYVRMQAYLGQFLGFELTDSLKPFVSNLDVDALHLQTQLAIYDLIRYMAEYHPLVLVLEDMHWVDDASLELLEFVVDRLDDLLPVLFCVSFRSQTDKAIWNAWPRIVKDYRDSGQIEVKELTTPDRRSLLYNFLDTSQPLAEDVEGLILSETDGNPLYLEEVLFALIENGTLVKREDRWQLTKPLNRIHVPHTLYQIIQSRIDELDFVSPGIRRLLWLAAVIGTRFTPDLLRDLFNQLGHDERAFQAYFRHLNLAAIFETDRLQVGTVVIPGRRFKHGLVQQVAYENMPMRQQRLYHREVGFGLEQLYVGNLLPHYDDLAYHFDASQAWSQAFHYHFLAGKRDARAFANSSAIGHFKRALELSQSLSVQSANLAQIYFELGQVLVSSGDFEQALAHLETAFNTYDAAVATEALRKARVCYEIGRIYELRGGKSLSEALIWQENGLALLPNSPTAEAALLHVLGGISNLRLGNWEAMARESRAALDVAAAVGTPHELSAAHRMMSVYGRVIGNLAQAMTHCQQAVEISQTQDDLIGLIKGVSNQGVIAFEMDDWPQAQASYLEAITLLERVGDRYELGRAHLNLSDLYAHMGEITAGFEHAWHAVDIALALQSTQELLLGRVILATLYWRQNEFNQALEQLAEADKLAETAVMFRPTVGRWLTQVYLSQGELAQANAQLQTLLALDDDVLDDEVEPIQALQAQLLARQGLHEEAIALLWESLSHLEDVQYQRAQALLVLAHILVEAERQPEAKQQTQLAFDIFNTLGARLDAAEAAGLLARLSAED